MLSREFLTEFAQRAGRWQAAPLREVFAQVVAVCERWSFFLDSVLSAEFLTQNNLSQAEQLRILRLLEEVQQVRTAAAAVAQEFRQLVRCGEVRHSVGAAAACEAGAALVRAPGGVGRRVCGAGGGGAVRVATLVCLVCVCWKQNTRIQGGYSASAGAGACRGSSESATAQPTRSSRTSRTSCFICAYSSTISLYRSFSW